LLTSNAAAAPHRFRAKMNSSVAIGRKQMTIGDYPSLGIGFITGRFPERSETFVADQVRWFACRTPEKPSVISLQPARQDCDDLLHGIPALHGVCLSVAESKLSRLKAAIQPSAMWRPLLAGKFLPLLNPSLGGSEALSLRPLLSFRALHRCEIPPSLWLCHFGSVGRLADCLRATGLLRGPLVTVFHGADVSIPYTRRRDIYRNLFRRGDLFLPISDFFAEMLCDMGCPRDKVVAHHLGVDTSAFRFRERRPTAGGPIVVLTVARLVEKKGIAHCIEAFGRLRARLDEAVEYWIVGDGPLRGRLEAAARSSPAASAIHFLGSRDRREIERLMDEAHIFMLPSVTASDGDMEGIPVSLMEAMSCGMPIIASRHSGVPELVSDGRSGFLGAEGDVDALTANLLRMLEAKDKWPQFGAAGREIILANFNAEVQNRRLADILVDRGLLSPGALRQE
jgi:colanic acid/amylovoran biosynthesis glycosyltransferase